MKLGHCPACSAPEGGGCRGGDVHEVRVRATYSRYFRALAEHLGNRFAAPSCEGYGLVDGLFAAADLLDGQPGPRVHVDCAAGSDEFGPRIPLAELVVSGHQSGDG